MSASILYKFRSSTTFEALPLPGSSARLFDVKKAIVLAKKLDQAGNMEFDLSVRDATTNEEYADENMLLPRGTRLIVSRLPASRGHGFLSRMARNPYGSSASGPVPPVPSAAPSNFYTIDSRGLADEDEFVAAKPAPPDDEEKELAALRAATESGRGDMRLHVATAPGGGFRPPPGGGHRGNNTSSNYVPRQRPNADPELRDQEKSLQPKKRPTGIPRTFQSHTSSAVDGSADGAGGESSVPILQPNAIGFAELVSRGGGQSESASNSNRLEYALKVTATTIPEFLQCAICHDVVKEAMILPWDPEGRTTCESCIRDALTQNGFRCPLTGQEGVSPDDLLPNMAIRKAAEKFVAGVMEKMEEIVKMQVDDDDDDVDFSQADTNKSNILEGDAGDNGVIVSKKMALTSRKKQQEDDPFAGEDDFGGDVFAIGFQEKLAKEEDPAEDLTNKEEVSAEAKVETDQPKKTESPTATKTEEVKQDVSSPSPKPVAKSPTNATAESSSPPPPSTNRTSEAGSARRDRRRGPPVGYSMGPAGGAALGPRDDTFSQRHDARGDVRDREYGGRGRDRDRDRGERYGRGERFTREDDREAGSRGHPSRQQGEGGETTSVTSDRGSKRPRSGSDYDDHPQDGDRYNSSRRHNDRDRSYNRNEDRRGDWRRGGRGGRGGYGGRGRSPPGRGGRGGYRGRGRY